MSEIVVSQANADEVRGVQVRRGLDDASIRISLELADRGTAYAARDQSEAIGLALVHATSDERFVGDAFVEPSYRGQGIGAQLLDAALSDAGDAARTLLCDPNDASALALLLRRSITPQTLLLRIAGAIPREDKLVAMAAGDYRFEVGPLDPQTHAFAIDALDRETRGTTRIDAHEAFARQANGLAFFVNGEFVAYAYLWPDGRIGPLASVSASYLVQMLAFALVTLGRTYGASWCTAFIPSANVRICRAALRAGLRIEETLTVATDSTTPDLSRYVAYHRLML